MNKLLRVISIAALFCFAMPVSAEVLYRGYQVGFESMYEADFETLTNERNTNLIRFQLTDANMDDITEASGEQAYIDLFDEVLDKADSKINAAAAAGNKVIIGIAMPPGGFKNRNASPPHSKMFSSPTLQEWYINQVVRIVRHFEDLIESGDIYAIDLLTEPADSPKEPNNGADDWEELVIRAIEAARAENPDVPLIVKSVYADPTKLTSLPALNYENIIYGYHWYFFNAYQHSGIYSDPFSKPRPGRNRVFNKALNTLKKFYRLHFNNFNDGLVPEYPPKFDVGEDGTSNCATGASDFLDDMLAMIERDDEATTLASCKSQAKSQCSGKSKKKARKKCQRKRIKKCKKKKKNNSGGGTNGNGRDFSADVQHVSWTHHAWKEAKYWDPTYVCDRSGNLTYEGQTDVLDVLDRYMSRNE